MRKLFFGPLLLVSSVLLTACGAPSPEKVCKHLMGLEEKKKEKEMKDSDKEKKLNRCVEKATKEKEKDPERYKCLASCFVDLKDIEDVGDCEKKCKKKDKDDDDKDKDKKKKKDDD